MLCYNTTTGSTNVRQEAVARGSPLLRHADTPGLGTVPRQQQQQQEHQENREFLEKRRFLQGIDTPSPVGEDDGGETTTPAPVDVEEGKNIWKRL